VIKYAVRNGASILPLTEVDDASWATINERGKHVNGLPVYCRKLPDGKLQVWPQRLAGHDIVRLVPVEELAD
jgi:hypothetical protein